MQAHVKAWQAAQRRLKADSRQGVILVLIALLIVIILGAIAFSVDIGVMQLARTKLRISTDAAARAAGEALSRTQDEAVARQAAVTVAAANLVGGEPLILAESDIVFGNSTRQPNQTWAFTPDVTPINSVRVFGRRTNASLSGSIPLFFAPVFGISEFEPVQTSTVVKLDRDICLVVDRSSSMKLDLATTAPTMSISDPRVLLPPDPVNSRWAALAGAVQVFLDTLDTTPQNENVALTSFASDFVYAGVTNHDTDIDQPLTTDSTQIMAGINTIGARVFNGMTHTAAGVDVGVTALNDPVLARPFAAKTIVYLTDGQRTVGNSPVAAATNAAAQNIVIHTITFGAVFDTSEMVAVAAITGGNHYHAPDAATLEQVFRTIALTLPLGFVD